MNEFDNRIILNDEKGNEAEFEFLDLIEYEGEEYTFEIKAMSGYAVSTDFPCIRRTNLPESITEAEYSLALAAIDSYRKE